MQEDQFNNWLQSCRISVKSSGSAPADCASATVGNVLDFAYSFVDGSGANNGNVARIVNNRDTARSQRFTYDELNRIATAETQATTGPHAWGLAFGYDIWANLLSASVTQGAAPMLSVGVNTKNQINNTGFAYDAAGNLVAEPGRSYSYNAENQLVATAGVAYSYDGDGRRVAKLSGNPPQPYKLYWYGMSSLDALAETDGAGNNATEYIFLGGKRIARRDPSGAAVYYFADHLGSSRIVTDATGTILDESDYYPFGGERAVASASGNAYKFTGKERDPETGLDFMKARYYASTYGRFLQADLPFADQHVGEPQSWNLYAYVRGNPLAYVDPSGGACAATFANTNSLFCVRAETYAGIDRILRDKTRFFAAASAVSLYGANTDMGVNVGVAISRAFGVSSTTSAFFSKLGEDLERMNWNIVKSLQDGSLGGENLDAKIVQMEQTKVQEALDNLREANPKEYERVISEANRALNPSVFVRLAARGLPSDEAFIQILDALRKQLGRDIDFARQSDREALGNMLIQHIRTTGGCDVTDNKATGC